MASQGEKGGEAGPSLKAGPSKAKIVTEPHSNGASKAAPTQRNKTGKEAQGKAAAKSEKEDVKPKKERKTFEMPGQTRETPDEVSNLLLILSQKAVCAAVGHSEKHNSRSISEGFL